MKMLLLQASKGTTITISADGSDEELALQPLIDLVDNKFTEEE